MAMTYSNATEALPPKAPTAVGTAEDLDPILSRLEELAQRASICADRVCGSRPQASDGKPSDNLPSYLIASLQYRRDRMSRAVASLQDEIARLETSIG